MLLLVVGFEFLLSIELFEPDAPPPVEWLDDELVDDDVDDDDDAVLPFDAFVVDVAVVVDDDDDDDDVDVDAPA